MYHCRSPEARALKIKMGTPYFKVKERLNKLDVAVLSSNYSLYGDMSRRLMNLLKNYCEQIEIYSIDEALSRFLDLMMKIYILGQEA